MNRPLMQTERPDVAEHGMGGAASEQRLFMQLLVFTGCREIGAAIESVQGSGASAVVYEAMNDPCGLGLLTWSREPGVLLDLVRPMLHRAPWTDYQPVPAMTMVGRSYALGHEADLEETLFTRPVRTVLNNDWPWAVWYPLRRRGSFAALTPEEQRAILMEHGKIGMAYVQHDLVHDVRLACHGLDAGDNDFLIGLIGRELAPLSKIVENMRKTKQTSLYLERLGPFFVGRAAWRSK